jgi:hypothetical protein
MQKHGHECTISKRDQVGRHGLYSRHYSRVFIAPKNAQNAETKCQSRAIPILLLAILAPTTSAYSSLGVWQGLNPQCWLLKASVYHSATSALPIGMPGTKREEEGIDVMCHRLMGMPGVKREEEGINLVYQEN